MNRRLFLLLTVIFCVTLYFQPQQEVQAIDPVTIAILTPVAIKAAQIMAPYVIAGLKRMGVASIKAGVHMVNILRLPLGVLEVTIGAPWFFKRGIRDLAKGIIAPFKFAFYTIMVPAAAFGLRV